MEKLIKFSLNFFLMYKIIINEFSNYRITSSLIDCIHSYKFELVSPTQMFITLYYYKLDYHLYIVIIRIIITI